MKFGSIRKLPYLCIVVRRKAITSFKAFALTGRQGGVRNYPGRCPGLGASALSGRAASGASLQGVLLLELLGLQGVLLLEFLGLQGVLEPHAKVQTLFKKGIKKD